MGDMGMWGRSPVTHFPQPSTSEQRPLVTDLEPHGNIPRPRVLALECAGEPPRSASAEFAIFAIFAISQVI